MKRLDRQIAKLLNYKFMGMTIDKNMNMELVNQNIQQVVGILEFNPSSDWEQAGYLLEKYKIRLSYCHYKPECTCHGWMADTHPHEFNIQAATPQEAICKTVVALLNKKP